jgi:hypothetical protein
MIPIVFMSVLPQKGRTVAGIFIQLRPHHSLETSYLMAGWYMIDVESHERAVELP